MTNCKPVNLKEISVDCDEVWYDNRTHPSTMHWSSESKRLPRRLKKHIKNALVHSFWFNGSSDLIRFCFNGDYFHVFILNKTTLKGYYNTLYSVRKSDIIPSNLYLYEL